MRAILLAALACLTCGEARAGDVGGWVSSAGMAGSVIPPTSQNNTGFGKPPDYPTTAGVAPDISPDSIGVSNFQENVMAQRAYTLSEIDRMRAAIKAKETTGLENWSDGIYRQPMPNEFIGNSHGISEEVIDRRVEDQLRTYMQAGISPEDLEAQAHPTSPAPQP